MNNKRCCNLNIVCCLLLNLLLTGPIFNWKLNCYSFIQKLLTINNFTNKTNLITFPKNASDWCNDVFLPLNKEFSVGAVEGDADLFAVLDLHVVEVPRDFDVGLLNLLFQTTFQLDVLALVFDLVIKTKTLKIIVLHDRR